MRDNDTLAEQIGCASCRLQARKWIERHNFHGGVGISDNREGRKFSVVKGAVTEVN
jgi:hypothetical protein